ncbi:MAG: histone family protein [Candidatus Helarchaeota archaeon]|mgnify:CR=1 FL=1
MPRERVEHVIPIAPIDRLIRKAKAERVSEKAAIALGEILEEVGLEIASMARELAEHAHRKTVNGEDIKLAYKQWRRKI